MTKIIISWNVNGLRAQIKKQYLYELCDTYNPDILCLNETKLSDDIDLSPLNFKHVYFNNSVDKKGYSGTCILTNITPKSITSGFIHDTSFDTEGRILTMELKNIFLVNVYVPNAGVNCNRLDYKIEWNKHLIKHIQILNKHKKVIVCGDFNVAHNEIDLARPKNNINHAGFTSEERQSFDELLFKSNLYDAYRLAYPSEIKYTYWDIKTSSRDRNIGWRIDYFLLSNDIDSCYDTDILTDIQGSDHAPIYLNI